MVNMLHRKVRLNDGFGISKVVNSTKDTKEDKEWKTDFKLYKSI